LQEEVEQLKRLLQWKEEELEQLYVESRNSIAAAGEEGQLLEPEENPPHFLMQRKIKLVAGGLYMGFFFFLGSVSLCTECTAALGLLYNPKYSIQHSLNNPAPRLKRQRSLTEAVLMSFGSTVSLTKTL